MSKSIFTAFSGAKRLLDSGRTVFEKLYDIPNRVINPVFAGADRPEFIVNKNKVEQAAIDKESENLFRDSEPSTDPMQGTRGSISFAENDWGITYEGKELQGKVIFGDNSTDRTYYNTEPFLSETRYVATFLIKPDDGLEPTIGGAAENICSCRFSGKTGSATERINIEPYSDGIWLITASEITGTNNLTVNGFRKSIFNNNVGFELTAIQFELGDYSTSYNRTTGTKVKRLAPSVSFSNYISPIQGTISICGSHIRKTQNYVIDNSAGDSRILYTFTNQVIGLRVFGANISFGSISIPYTDWMEYENKDLATIISYTTTSINLFIVDSQANMYAYLGTHDFSDASNNGFHIGSKPSGDFSKNRFYLLPSFSTDFISTVESAKKSFEIITRGSLNLKASEITLMNP